VVFQELGFGQLPTARPIEVDGATFAISHGWGRVPIHLVSARVDLDQRQPGMTGAARVSPHGLVQDALNRSDEHLWGIVTNGRRLRLLRDNAALTRQAYVEWDLEAIVEQQAYADFALVWLVCHQSRFEGDPAATCVLEQWVEQARTHGVRALDSLRAGVETAIVELGTGFVAHPDNRALRDALASGALTNQDLYRQLLRLVYRLLFLAAADGRDLLCPADADPAAADRYRRFYSLERLRRLAEARRGAGPHGDLWQQLRVVVGALGRAGGEPALALPGLGSFLWSPRACPDLDGAALANRQLLGALRAVGEIRDGGVRRRVDYANLGAEELGSIYESLLELHVEVDVAGVQSRVTLATAAGNERKTTGSYYTPASLIAELCDSALEPVLDRAARQAEPERAILALTVIDPACGSGSFLLAAAHRIARRLAVVRAGGDEPSPAQTRHALRDVIAHCIHGIDVNDMAVELCKVGLWLESMEPGRPLAFLERRIVHGNALLGATPALLAAGVPDDAWKPLTGDDKATVTAIRKRNQAERRAGLQSLFALGGGPDAVAADVDALEAMPDGTVEEIAAKQRAWEAVQRSAAYRAAALAADAWCTAFVAPRVAGAPAITDAVVRAAATDPDRLDDALRTTIDTEAARYGFLHWHLAFPEIYADGAPGGFDVVLGNPPWEKVKLSEKEFFATRAPEVANAAGAKRKALIAKLQADEPDLWNDYQAALRQAEGESHLLRSSGRYPLCGRGDVNTYAVFAEVMRDALAPTGRLGVIVPTGIATDDTTKLFFGDCVTNRRLVSLYDFENAEKLFPGVDSRMKFCLLTLAGPTGGVAAAEFAFFARQAADLADPERRFTLSPEDLALINPNTKTAPVFRSRRDAELTKRIYRTVPVLVRDGDPAGNPWGIEYQRMFDMTNDSHLFRSADDLAAEGATLHGNVWVRGDQRWLPLYEGRLGHQFNHRFVTNSSSGEVDLSEGERCDPRFVVQPAVWVAEGLFAARLTRRVHGSATLLGFRRVARNTDERTTIAALLPPAPASYGWILTVGPATSELALLGAVYNSFCFDYCSRAALSQPSFPQSTFEQLPALPPAAFDAPCTWGPGTVAEWLRPRTLELTYTAWDLAGFAADLGWDGPPFRWDPERRAVLRAELDAAMFLLYGLDRDDVDYVLDTFPIVRRNDEKAHGEFRTKRLILERYDALVTAARTGAPYRTPLDPPPADPRCAHDPSTRPDWADTYA
jgi:hypothetical protein